MESTTAEGWQGQQCQEGERQKAGKAIAQHIETIQQELIRETEIARIRTRVANHFIFGNETPSDRAGLYGYYQSLLGDLAAAVDYPEWIQSIHAEDLRGAAQQFLSAHAYGPVAICPAACIF